MELKDCCRIIPCQARAGTKVETPDGREIPHVVEVRWIHRAGYLPRIELELASGQVDALTADGISVFPLTMDTPEVDP